MSQVLHIINSTANRLWLNKRKGGAKREELEEEGAKVAGVVDYEDTPPVQTDAPSIPTGHIELAKTNVEMLTRLSGVNEPMQGNVDRSGQSGYAIQLRQLQGIKMAKPIFGNMNLTRQLVYEGIVELIQKMDIYSLDEIKAIVDKEDLIDNDIQKQVVKLIGPPPQPPQQAPPEALSFVDSQSPGSAATVMMKQQQDMATYQKLMETYQANMSAKSEQLLYEQMTSLSTGRYGVATGTRPNNATMRVALFQTLLDARKMGLMIPDDVIFEASDWPDKIKQMLIQRIKQMQAQPPQMALPQKVG
jgi:hypothetical protein